MSPNMETPEASTTKTTGQSRVDGSTRTDAWNQWKDAAAEHAQAVDDWRSAKELKSVRDSDLVKAYDDEDATDQLRAKVAKLAASATKKQGNMLSRKQDAKKKLDVAYEFVQSFEEHPAPKPIIPDPEDDEEEAPAPKPKKPLLDEKRARETDADFTGKKDGTSDVSKLKEASDARKVSGDKKGK